MEIIQKWITNGCVYADGLKIYQSLPRINPNLLRMFNRGENATSSAKLKNELQKLIVVTKNSNIAEISEIPEISEIIGITATEYEKKQSVFFHQLPPELQPELLKANTAFRENCLLKVQLNDLPDNAEIEALRIQLLISENWKTNATCWKNIDYYLEHKKLPFSDLSEFDNLTGGQLAKRQQYLYQNISKKNSNLKINRAKLKKVDDVREKSRLERLVAKQEKYLLKYENELRIITKKIDG